MFFRAGDSYHKVNMRTRKGETSLNSLQERAAEPPTNGEALSILYESPLLLHLLSTGRWEDAEQKLVRLFRELRKEEPVTQELLTEIYCMCYASFRYTLRRQGMSRFAIRNWEVSPDHTDSLEKLEEWAFNCLRQIRAETGDAGTASQADIIREVKRVVRQQMDEEISLQKLSDEVHLHPKYLSWLFKQETGEGVNEYVNRVKMEHAAEALKTSRKKVYEIAAGLGFQNPSYFIQVFKTRYGMTPQQYRNREKRS